MWLDRIGLSGKIGARWSPPRACSRGCSSPALRPALLLGTIVVVARIAATIYRVGILMYGKRPTVRELVRWVRTA